MRKQQLIHLHALCLCLRGRLEARTRVPADAFARYDAMDLGPTAVHRPKSVHHEAVVALLDGLTTTIVAAEDGLRNTGDSDSRRVDPGP